MRFPRLIISCYIILLSSVLSGCSGNSSVDHWSSEVTTNNLNNKQVVSGLVYGYGPTPLVSVVGATYLSKQSGQFVFVNFSTEKPNKGQEVSALFADNRLLYSFWSGRELDRADVSVTINNAVSEEPTRVEVNPNHRTAVVNINTLTNLAYNLWQYNMRHGNQGIYSDYSLQTFLFMERLFPKYVLRDQVSGNGQDVTTDIPSSELLRLLNNVQVKSDSTTGFSLICRATAQVICAGEFTTFPICKSTEPMTSLTEARCFN